MSLHSGTWTDGLLFMMEDHLYVARDTNKG